MGSIYVSFIVKSVSVNAENNELFEKSYQSVYKPILKFLYSHPSFPLTFKFTGPQLQFYKRRKNEIITLVRELTDRKQIEVLGGAYHDALLPLLNSIDRNGQIDELTSEIRQTFGKRPRGMTLFQDCWDSSLVNNIHNCGIEYVILSSSLIPDNKKTFLPIFMSDLGKSIDIFASYDEFIPYSQQLSEEFIWNIEKAVMKAEKKDSFLQLDADRIVVINLTAETALELTNSKWFEKLDKYLQTSPGCRVKLTTPNDFRTKNVKTKIQSYIPVGISNEISNIIQTDKNEKNRFPYSIYDFLYTYSPSMKLYNRMMYISLLVNQYKTDKMRKKAAREKLWLAQNGAYLLATAKEPVDNNLNRQQAYKYLSEAEKMLRSEGDFVESLTSFDYDNDGIPEYVCRMEQYFAYISLNGGAVRELDIMKNLCNYADNLKRRAIFDGFDDDYERGIFIDHLFTSEQFKNYSGGEPAGDGVFSRIQYSELKYSQSHKELQLCARAVWKPTGQTVYLRKKYVINSTGMYVQYIIKNESDKTLGAKFAVESNISNIFFKNDDKNGFNIETVDNGEIFVINPKKSTKEINAGSKLKNIQLVRMSDNANGISFVFEPNEKCGYCMNPIIFNRQNMKGDEAKPVSMTYESTLYWDINIGPGMETEKSINFTIIPVKKIKN